MNDWKAQEFEVALFVTMMFFGTGLLAAIDLYLIAGKEPEGVYNSDGQKAAPLKPSNAIQNALPKPLPSENEEKLCP
jgi:hypothetical protein